jgi:hypothetical protein
MSTYMYIFHSTRQGKIRYAGCTRHYRFLAKQSEPGKGPVGDGSAYVIRAKISIEQNMFRRCI